MKPSGEYFRTIESGLIQRSDLLAHHAKDLARVLG